MDDSNTLDLQTDRTAAVGSSTSSASVLPSPVWLRSRFLTAVNWLTLGELLVVVLWAIVVTRPWLTMNMNVIPIGGEYHGAIQIHYIWNEARECGWCMMWYGSVGGGYPSFVDPNGSQLHPLVIVATLIWGVLKGARVVLGGIFILAGLAQWWLGRVLGVGRVARLWTACMVIAGSHLSVRMQGGYFPQIVATVAASLAIPALVLLGRRPNLRHAALLGIILAQLIVSGNGYPQVALLLALPAVLVLPDWNQADKARSFGSFAFAGIVALLVAAPFLVPFMRFFTEFAKDTDPNFGSAQSLIYIPFNLVIQDMRYYDNASIVPNPWPSHYLIFIGWIPVLLAIWGIQGNDRAWTRRAALFLALFAGIVFWSSAGGPQSLIIKYVPIRQIGQFFAGARFTPFMSSLAVPAILGLSALGLDRLLNYHGWPKLRLQVATQQTSSRLIALNSQWLLAIPLLFALREGYTLSRNWIQMRPLGPEIPAVIEGLRTPDLQWVNVPFGEGPFVAPAVEAGLKLATNSYLTWHWRDHPYPAPTLEIHRNATPEGMTKQGMLVNMVFNVASGREYASVISASGERTVCTAQGLGGNIDVRCDLPKAGTLTTLENNWSGWQAWIDGRRVELRDSRWLVVDVPEGNHRIEFRYRPWDVPVGLVLMVVGLTLCGLIWWRGERLLPLH